MAEITCDVCQGMGEIEEEDYRWCDNCNGEGVIRDDDEEE